ncbi:MAG: 4-hydroxy-3-methylbut-2-enyl diphosphate reductase [Bacteroidales bacterium]|nr:4-hydroxy-3-methylbut-2-enyl diphosphate reductase [Bacteroidales bacterium]
MRITIDDHSGFCFGVIHAIETAERYLQDHDTLYCLGDLVHNNEEVARLKGIGLRVITHEQFKLLHDTTVLIRAHGEPPSTYDIARQNHITLIDATCPVVLRLQQSIFDFHHNHQHQECQILIFGKKGHAEVIGLLGQVDGQGLVISSEEELDRIDYTRPAMLYSQTTQELEQYYRLIQAIQDRYEASGNGALFLYKDTICRKVALRAEQTAEFARQHDTILFVSDEKSSNGLYLFNICKKHNPNSHFITRAEQVLDLPLSLAESVGICGATSTPRWLMEECAKRCQESASEENFSL